MRVRILLAVSVLVAASGAAWGKLPPLTEEQKAAAAAAKAKADDAAKRDAASLAKEYDKVLANYRKNKGGAKSAKK